MWKRRLFRVALLLVLVSSSGLATSASPNFCRRAVLEQDGPHREEMDAYRFAEAQLADLQSRSGELTTEIQGATAEAPYVVDVLGIGGGPNAAIFFANLREVTPFSVKGR